MPVYNDSLSEYITTYFTRPDAVLEQVRQGIRAAGLPAITITPEEGRFLQFLVRGCGARRAVEIGTLGGYSGIWLAWGLAEGGKLITLEKEPRHAQVAREHFALAGLTARVDLLVGDARELLGQLSSGGPFDFCFIDAEKSDYGFYLDWALENVLPGGVIAAHNAFRRGEIVDPNEHSQATESMRAFNQRFAAEPRLLATIYPAGDGTLVGVVLP